MATLAAQPQTTDGMILGDYGYKYHVLDGLILPPHITPERYQLSRTFETRLGDVCVTSYPKSGTTWLAYIVFLIIQQGEVPQDKTLRDIFHLVAGLRSNSLSRTELAELPSPRMFKSHMPYHMALGGNPSENQCKYIYIARNPKDVMVSYYHFESIRVWSGDYTGSWEHWFDLFTAGKAQRGDWFNHVLSWWEHRNTDNILFLKYEELKQNFDAQVEQIARFLDYPLSPALMAKIKHKTDFSNMKSDPFTNMDRFVRRDKFFRKGTTGSWREQFTPTQNDQFAALYAQRMAGSGLTF